MSQLRKLDVSAVSDTVDICAGLGSLLPSPARDWPVGRLSTSPFPAPVTGVTPSVQPDAGPAVRRGGALLPGGGLDPGGVRAPSRQRQSALAADGTEPVRRVARALFPLPCERRKRRGGPGCRKDTPDRPVAVTGAALVVLLVSGLFAELLENMSGNFLGACPLGGSVRARRTGRRRPVRHGKEPRPWCRRRRPPRCRRCP